MKKIFIITGIMMLIYGCKAERKLAYVCDIYGDPVSNASVVGRKVMGSITSDSAEKDYGRTDTNGRIDIYRLNNYVGDLGTQIIVEANGYKKESKIETFTEEGPVIIILWRLEDGDKPPVYRKSIRIFP